MCEQRVWIIVLGDLLKPHACPPSMVIVFLHTYKQWPVRVNFVNVSTCDQYSVFGPSFWSGFKQVGVCGDTYQPVGLHFAPRTQYPPKGYFETNLLCVNFVIFKLWPTDQSTRGIQWCPLAWVPPGVILALWDTQTPTKWAPLPSRGTVGHLFEDLSHELFHSHPSRCYATKN